MPPVSDAASLPAAAPLLAQRGARPPVWLYYERLSETSASCRFCQRVIRGAPTSSGNYWVHLKRLHAEQIARLGGEHAALADSWRAAAGRKRGSTVMAAAAEEARQMQAALHGALQRTGAGEEVHWMAQPPLTEPAGEPWTPPPPPPPPPPSAGQQTLPASSQSQT